MKRLFRHKKTKGLYLRLFTARLQVTHIPLDMVPCIVYLSLKDFSLWVRPHKDFFDGRFTKVTLFK